MNHIIKDIIREIKHIPYNIKTILQWSKILWNNFDWEGNFLLEIIEYKLKRMKKYFETASITTEETYSEMIEKISDCLYAVDQLCSDEYNDKIFEDHYNKYPLEILKEKSETGNIIYKMKSMGKDEKAEFKKLTKISNQKNKELRHQLFDTMRDYYDNWWD
jgi:hypothetical protein